MNQPEFIPNSDWRLVVRKCVQGGVNPYLIAAIGWHETHWGRLGWGKLGFHLGVGCYTETDADYSLQGLEKQVSWAVNQLQSYVLWLPNLSLLTTFAKKIWRPGNPEKWAESVNSFFEKYMKLYGQDLYSYVPPPEWAKKVLLDFYDQGFVNTPYGTTDFYRFVVTLQNVIKFYLLR